MLRRFKLRYRQVTRADERVIWFSGESQAFFHLCQQSMPELRLRSQFGTSAYLGQLMVRSAIDVVPGGGEFGLLGPSSDTSICSRQCPKRVKRSLSLGPILSYLLLIDRHRPPRQQALNAMFVFLHVATCSMKLNRLVKSRKVNTIALLFTSCFKKTKL